MSILIIEVLPQGMIFAADRALTVTKEVPDQGQTAMYQAQELGPKILRWPRGRGLIGYVGLARIGGQSTHDWLFDFMGDHVEFSDPGEVAADLRNALQDSVGNLSPPQGLIIQFGAFKKHQGITVPEMWHVTNIHGMNNDTGEYDPPTNSFRASEEILGHWLNHIRPNGVRSYLQTQASTHNPFWFHHGINLVIFNTLEHSVKEAFKALQEKGKLQPPSR